MFMDCPAVLKWIVVSGTSQPIPSISLPKPLRLGFAIAHLVEHTPTECSGKVNPCHIWTLELKTTIRWAIIVGDGSRSKEEKS